MTNWKRVMMMVIAGFVLALGFGVQPASGRRDSLHGHAGSDYGR